MKKFRTLVLIGLGLIIGKASMAQDKWSAELRPNINFATQDIGNADLKTGFGFEAAVGYRFMPHLGAYVGWGWNKFASDTPSFPGTGNTDFEMTGYTFGLQFIHPINNSSLSYLIRAGGIYNHIEVENDAGDITADSDHGLGWEIGAGLQVDLGSNWNLRPQIGYRALSRDIEIGNTTTDVDLNYISFGVGIAKIF
ncbi:porin family protein [Flagellimonas lutaonensis]|nr:porin family protein [Allomuricauda lutaonensis]